MRKALLFLLDLEIWLVGGLVAAGFLTAAVLPWAVFVAAGFWPLRWLAYRRWTLPTPADIPIGLLVLLMPVTLWATPLPDVTLPQVYRLLGGIGLYYAIVNWVGNTPRQGNAPQPLKRLRWLGIGLAGAALFLGLFAFISVQWNMSSKLTFIPASLYSRFPILVSDSANPNVMSGSLVILLPLALAAAVFGWRQIHPAERLFYAVAALLVSVVLVLTQSRGGLMGLGVLLLVLMGFRLQRGWFVVAAACAGGLMALAWFGPEAVLNLLLANARLGGIDGRVEVWSRAVYMIQDFPFTGVGMGCYGRVADLLYPFFLYAPGTLEHAHNLLLQIAVDLGIPGLISWLAVWGLVTVTAWQVFQRGQRLHNHWLAGVGVGLLCSQLALLVHGQVDAVTWGMVRPAPIVWALWGFTMAAWIAGGEAS